MASHKLGGEKKVTQAQFDASLQAIDAASLESPVATIARLTIEYHALRILLVRWMDGYHNGLDIGATIRLKRDTERALRSVQSKEDL